MSSRRPNPRVSRRATLDAWQLASLLVGTAEHTGAPAPLAGAIRNRNVSRVCELCDEWFARALKRADTSYGPPSLSLEDSAQQVYLAMQCKALFSKNVAHTARDATEVALRGFLADEAENRKTNERLTAYRQGLLTPTSPEVSAVLERSVEIVDRLLGPFTRFLDRLPFLVKLTSGATVREPRARSHRFRKVSNRAHFGSKSVDLGRLLAGFIGLKKPRFRIVDHNLLTVVPKNYKTGRTIACEPEGSLALQLAFDGYAKQRLARVGQDLSDQSRNSDAARVGSVNGLTATIDLRSASNSLVFALLDLWSARSPNLAKYVDYLYRVRSASYVTSREPGAQAHRYEMFSSMGNGATFALETIVFWSIGRALGASELQVYGDDIVIDRHLAAPIMRVLSFIGFNVNEDKTFVDGPFRESCGGNFLSGIDVTPVYIRRKPNDPLLCHLLNLLLQKRSWLPVKAVQYLESIVARRPDLPFVPPTAASWQGLWANPDWLLWEGRLRDRVVEGASDLNQLVTSGFAGMVPVVHVRDMRTYLLWLLDHRKEASDVALAWDEDPILASLQSSSRPVQWSRKEVAVGVGNDAEGYAGETWH